MATDDRERYTLNLPLSYADEVEFKRRVATVVNRIIRDEGLPPRWEDARTPAGALKYPGGAAPTDATVGPAAILMPHFATGNYVYAVNQMPHAYKQLTPIVPHIHWMPATSATAGSTVIWQLDYQYARVNEVLNGGGPVYITQTCAGSSLTHQIANFGSLTLSLSLSSMLMFKITRSGGTYGGTNAVLLEFDYHYQRDTRGSQLEYTKYASDTE